MVVQKYCFLLTYSITQVRYFINQGKTMLK